MLLIPNVKQLELVWKVCHDIRELRMRPLYKEHPDDLFHGMTAEKVLADSWRLRWNVRNLDWPDLGWENCMLFNVRTTRFPDRCVVTHRDREDKPLLIVWNVKGDGSVFDVLGWGWPWHMRENKTAELAGGVLVPLGEYGPGFSLYKKETLPCWDQHMVRQLCIHTHFD